MTGNYAKFFVRFLDFEAHKADNQKIMIRSIRLTLLPVFAVATLLAASASTALAGRRPPNIIIVIGGSEKPIVSHQ